MANGPLLPGDVDGDRHVDLVDGENLLDAFGSPYADPDYRSLADLDGDAWINFLDYQQWLDHYRPPGPPSPTSIPVVLRLDQPSIAPIVGETFTISVVADASTPILGFGLDLEIDAPPGVLELVGPPEIGPVWVPLHAPDGDALAGAVLPEGLVGQNLVLATLTLRALALGIGPLSVLVSADDLTEGFPLDPTGFEAFAVTASNVTVPEPRVGGSLWIAMAGLTLLTGRRSRGGPRPGKADVVTVALGESKTFFI